MNKLLLLVIILAVLLGLYWYQSKVDDKTNKEEYISLTDNEETSKITESEEEKDNYTLQSFNPAVLERSEDELSDVNNSIIMRNREETEESNFSDSDLNEDNQDIVHHMNEID